MHGTTSRHEAGEGAVEMSVTRRDFFEALAGSTVLLGLQACGGGGDSGSGSGSGLGFGGGCGAGGTAINNNHGHTLAVPATDLTSLVNETYSIQGSAGHSHDVTFTPAQLQSLKNGGVVALASTTGADATYPAHTHTVTASCP
jgi:hypothetical protein